LHAAGFADPGRAPNYWKIYPADQIDDATVTQELLSQAHPPMGAMKGCIDAVRASRRALRAPSA
jgi:hypothetical protein